MQGLDAAVDGFVRQIFPLSIGIQHGKQERGEFMSTRYATELDTGFHAFFQQCKFRSGLVGLGQLARQLFGATCHIIQESDELVSLLVLRVIGDMKDITGFQMLEYASHLV